MEPCTRTPDLFHGRTREQTAALHPPPLRYTAVRHVRAIVPPEYKEHGEGTGGPYTIRRIAYADNPLSLDVTPRDPQKILDVWEILQPGDPDYCCGVLLRRRHPVSGRVQWCYWDGTCEQQEERLGYAVWDCAFYSQQGGLSSTGWRRQRYPNPPPEF
ncbi:hypothetical protein [Methylobacterium oryzae]|uniref:hypothetical protein n=1 Tax=Methylobacterium oryzae TaxID=334852 RepID=UPI001F28FB43|nr:hypothetical protein [Methylobacterium oryzae]UIN36933.1 hypothetical protein LXM90_10725 [Methylobacterium oryzae]